MDRYQETFKTWDKVADLYQQKFMDLTLYDDTYDFFCEQLFQKNPSLLEIGCGPGNVTKYLLRKRPDFKITGIDIAPNMIALAKENNPSAFFEVMDSRAIDNIEKSFNAIVGGFCIPYLSSNDCSKLIRDCSALLQEHGLLYLSFVEGEYKDSGYQIGSNGDRVYFYFHCLEELNKEFEVNDFELIYSSDKSYKKGNDLEEIHKIVIVKKRS